MFGIEFSTFVVLCIAAFVTSILHGALGLAGGILMAIVIAHVVGIKNAIPIMTCALVFSHASRTVLFRHDADWVIAKRVLMFGLPTIVLGAWIFSWISPRTVAVIFVLFLTASLPVKYWARRHNIETGPKLLAGASAIWGILAGNVIGPGVFLAPFLQGTGMNRQTFVGTVAVITLAMNITKLLVFGMTDLLNTQWLLLGCTIGLITIPGNYVGKKILATITDHTHGVLIDLFTIAMIANFVYFAIYS